MGQLNSLSPQQQDRIRQLLALWRQLPEVLATAQRHEIKQPNYEQDRATNQWEVVGSNTHISYHLTASAKNRELINDINRMLARYPVRRQISSVVFGTSAVLEVQNVGLRKHKLGRPNEASAVHQLVGMLEMGESERIHTCPICQRFFMGERPDQVYCGSSCAGRKHRQTRRASGKEREYVRNFRKRQKLKDQIAELELQKTKKDVAVALTKLRKQLANLMLRKDWNYVKD